MEHTKKQLSFLKPILVKEITTIYHFLQPAHKEKLNSVTTSDHDSPYNFNLHAVIVKCYFVMYAVALHSYELVVHHKYALLYCDNTNY